MLSMVQVLVAVDDAAVVLVGGGGRRRHQLVHLSATTAADLEKALTAAALVGKHDDAGPVASRAQHIKRRITAASSSPCRRRARPDTTRGRHRERREVMRGRRRWMRSHGGPEIALSFVDGKSRDDDGTNHSETRTDRQADNHASRDYYTLLLYTAEKKAAVADDDDEPVASPREREVERARPHTSTRYYPVDLCGASCCCWRVSLALRRRHSACRESRESAAALHHRRGNKERRGGRSPQSRQKGGITRGGRRKTRGEPRPRERGEDASWCAPARQRRCSEGSSPLPLPDESASGGSSAALGGGRRGTPRSDTKRAK